MNKKIVSLIGAGAVVVALAVVGGWISSGGGNSNATSEESSVESSSAEESAAEGNSGGESVAESTSVSEDSAEEKTEGAAVDRMTDFNTDTPLENLTIEIEEYFNEYIIYKVTNNSDVCYKYIGADVYFTCDPLPGRLPSDKEYHNPISLDNIPAYSVTYHLEQAFGEEMSTEKGGTQDGRMYYPFDISKDPYRIEFRTEFTPVSTPYILSEEPMQNAWDYISFDYTTYDLSQNKLCTINNSADQHVEFHGFVVFANGTAVKIQNGSELIDSKYEDVIPANGVDLEGYDCNSWYTNPYDYEITAPDYQVYFGSAWFIDEAQQY